MELHIALRKLIEENGLSIFDSKLFQNILNDYGAYSENLAYKNVLRFLIEDGYLYRIGGDQSISTLFKLANEVERQYGIKESISKKVVLSIAYGLGSIDEMPVLQSTPETTEEEESTQSQEDVEIMDDGSHMTFRGIPIDGSADRIAKKLTTMGYRIKEQDGNIFLLNGSFAGISNCDIFVGNSEFINSVVKVSVLLPEDNAWFSLKADYEGLKEKFIKKYGKPISSYEFFDDPYYEGDGYEQSAFSAGKAGYYTTFQHPMGQILLAIIGSGDRVIITYTDKANGDKENASRESFADIDL